jgi:hypothetical protein
LVLISSTCGPLCASHRAHYDGTAATSNRRGMCAGWLPGPRKEWQMLRAFCRMYEASIKYQRWVIFPCLTTFWRSVCPNQGTVRWGGGGFKPTWYVCRVAPRAPAAVAVLRALGWGTRRRSRAKDEENGPYFVNLWPSVCIAQGTYDGAAAASNRQKYM